MSVFSNPASGAPEHARAYVDAVLGLVEDRDRLEILRTSPAWFANAVTGLAEAALLRPEAPGKWSIGQVLQHLADSELVWGYRLRRILSEDRPTLHGFDQDAWADALDYATGDAQLALDVFRALRSVHVRLLERAGPDALRRVGVHAERGEESLDHLVSLYAGHDLAHRRQVERIRAAFA